jgi:hypothetical protein
MMSDMHMRLRDIMLYQPGSILESTQLTLPWYEPPFLPPTSSDVIEPPRERRTPGEVATYLKGRYKPNPAQGKRPRELSRITTHLVAKPTEETVRMYSEWEASASLYVAIGIVTHDDGIRQSGFELQTLETARGLLVLVACVIRYLQAGCEDPAVDPTLLEGLVENFSFAEIRKRSIHTRFCAVICETGSDRDTLEICGGIILPMGQMSLYVTFSPTADDTVRTSLPKEIRLALRSHKALFFPGGLVLSVTSSISASAVFIFQITLLTLLCMEQLDQVPTPTERPRPALEEATGRAPQGYAPWLLRILTKVAEDAAKGARPLP